MRTPHPTPYRPNGNALGLMEVKEVIVMFFSDVRRLPLDNPPWLFRARVVACENPLGPRDLCCLLAPKVTARIAKAPR